MIEELYEDFTTKLLPKVAEGLVITKDYFIDLFGRYIRYLVITDSLLVLMCLVLVVGGGYLLYRGIKYGVKTNWDAGGEIPMIMIGSMCLIFGGVGLVVNSMNLVKDIYIPEVRIYKEIKGSTE